MFFKEDNDVCWVVYTLPLLLEYSHIHIECSSIELLASDAHSVSHHVTLCGRYMLEWFPFTHMIMCCVYTGS